MNARKLAQVLQEAVAHHQAGRLEAANRLYRDVLRVAPRQADALQLAGVVALQQGRPGEAVELLTRAARETARSAVCAMRLGVAFLQLGRLAEAEDRLARAVEWEPKLAEAWGHRSAALEGLGRLEEAIRAAERAVALQPDAVEWRERLGALLVATRGHAAAETHYRHLVGVHQQHAAGWTNLGICLTYGGKVSEALACFDRALAAEPNLHHARVGRGLALERCYRIAEACESYARAIAGQPDHWQARSARLLCLHYLDGVSRETLGREHREFGAAVAVRNTGPRPVAVGPPERRLRVGFLSADLRRHAVASFLEPILRHLDRAEFEVVLYHDHSQVDEVSARLRALAAAWRHVAGQRAAAVAARVRADRIDILIDLAGHTGINRLPLLARRLAPVQATYLGYPDTTGLAAMDYRLVDAITDPVGDADEWHSERLMRFAPTAWSYAPPDDAPEVAPAAAVTLGHVTFGCFNNFAKVTDAMLGHWAALLAAVPESRLLLKGSGLGDPVLGAAAEQRFAAAGLPRERVELLERTETEAEHLATYARVDIALDTFPYHGTTTTCEALWMGVPVVTLAGDRHGSRVGASLLKAVGRVEWVAGDAREYVRLGVELASDVPRLARGRRELREAMRRSALLDHAGQARRFGDALRAMWRERIGTEMTEQPIEELPDVLCR